MVDFREEYQRVFDENNEIRPCGRDVCTDLILQMQKAFPDETFGDVNTGYMDVFKIKRFYNKTYHE